MSNKRVITPTPSLVAPSRINKMGGTYLPVPAAPQRAGSDHHTHIHSLRQGRRVPFVAGYISLQP